MHSSIQSTVRTIRQQRVSESDEIGPLVLLTPIVIHLLLFFFFFVVVVVKVVQSPCLVPPVKV